MMVDIHLHPSARRHGIENARQIIRDLKGAHSDAMVTEACNFLMAYGDGWDFAEAEKVNRAMAIERWGGISRIRPHRRWTLDSLLFAMGLAFVVGIPIGAVIVAAAREMW